MIGPDALSIENNQIIQKSFYIAYYEREEQYTCGGRSGNRYLGKRVELRLRKGYPPTNVGLYDTK